MNTKQQRRAPAKKIDKREEKRESSLEDSIDEDTQPWKNVFRPTCSQQPKDNSFTLDDEAAAVAAEGFMASFTVSDPNEEENPLCYVSPGFTTMTGYAEQECLGRNCNFLQAGKVDPAVHETLHSTLTERRVATVELTNYRKDGKPFQNLLTVAPVLGADGSSLLHYVGVQCDLDDRRRRGETVDDAFLSRWQELAKHCLSAFALVDVSGGGGTGAAAAGLSGGPGGLGAALSGSGAGSRGSTAPSGAPQPAAAVCAVSPGFTALTGYSQSDVMGWNLLCLCGPDSAERDMRKLITAQWAHTPTAVKLLCYKRDGTPFWALILSFPLTRNTAAAGGAAAAASGVGTGLGAAALGHQSQAAAPPARLIVPAGSTGRGGQGQVGGANRTGGLGFGGLLGGGVLMGISGGANPSLGLLSGLSAGNSPAAGGGVTPAPAPVQPVVRHCLCCVVDITAQRLKKLGGKYLLGKVIGAGAFGLVRIGRNAVTDELVAVKGVDATRFRNITELDQIQEEMSVLASLKHPNIIRLYDVHFQNNTFFLVMEFAGNGSLVHFMRSHGDPGRHCLDEATAARVFVQMVAALDYCHRRRIVHRDLKPENILLDENNNLKIADFGLAAVAAPFNGGLTLQCGTPEFTAPEITVGREYDGPSVDIWSMGVILYEVLCGSLPFKGANQAALFKAIQKGVYDPLPGHISQDCKDLVRRMLLVDPAARVKMEDILCHPWLVKASAAPAATAAVAPDRTPGAGGNVGASGGGSLCDLSGAGSSDVGGSLSNGGAAGGPQGGSAALTPRGSSSGVADNSRPGSAAWRGTSANARGAPPSRIMDGSGPGVSQHLSRPTSGGLGTVVGASLNGTSGPGPVLGPPSPSGAQPPMGLTNPDGSPTGALHDSVKLVLPSQVDRDDPILAAILRGHGHVATDATSQSPTRSAADDGESGAVDPSGALPGYPPGHPGSMGRKDPVAAASARVGHGGRTVGGAGGLHGQGQAQSNGKARGGALLPTLGGVNSSNGATVLERRLQDPGRFRSPARGGQAGGAGGGMRGGTVSVVTTGPRGQQASQTGAPVSPGQSPHGGHAYTGADSAGRQLPPIQNNRALGKKSSRMPGA